MATKLTVDVLGARRRGRRLRAHRRALLESTIEPLLTRPLLADLEEAWQRVIATAETPINQPTTCQLVALIANAEPEATDAMRTVFSRYVDSQRRLGEFIDEGLIKPMDFAREYPDLHAQLLHELHLIEPFIWYESILERRGRWGYRPVQLRKIFEQLRSASPRATVRAAMHLECAGMCWAILPSSTGWKRILARLRTTVRSPTINTRTKISQMRYRDQLAEELKGLGYLPHGDAGSSTEW